MTHAVSQVVPAPLLVLAVGNPSRGDDAFGPLLAEQFARWLSGQPLPIQASVALLVDFQLMVEHVYDLQGRRKVLFIDAAAQGAPGVPGLAPVQPSTRTTVHSHACTPAQLLGLYAELLKQPPPSSDLLSMPGEGFELGAALSPAIEAAMPQALGALQAWLEAHLASAPGVATPAP